MRIADEYDAMGNPEIAYNDYVNQFMTMVDMISHHNETDYPVQSIYEVGCGCGPNLLLMGKKGYSFGGCDYSESLVDSARDILGQNCDLMVCEAIVMPMEPKYDAVVSKGVFSYFQDEEYAFEVLNKMLLKAKYSIGVLDIHDIEKEEEYLTYRRQQMSDYDERYKGLGRLFMSKESFADFAEKNSCEIEFTETDLKGYWNNEYIFNVYMYKK